MLLNKEILIGIYNNKFSTALLNGFSMSIDTTKPGATSNNQFQLALAPSTSYDFVIDWGDETDLQTYTSSNTTGYTHTYQIPSTYLITIKERTVGGFPKVYYNNTGDRAKILNVTQFGSNQFGTDWASSFYGCSSLQALGTDFATAKTQNITTFSNTWNGCTSLLSFPLIDTSKGTLFLNAWSNCTSLSSFPLINTSNVINFNSTWQNCSSLLSFPQIFTLSATNFRVAWQNCSSLSAFPLINTSNGINFNRTWQNCSSLSSFPLIDTSRGTNFSFAWNGCSSLTAFPLINTSAGIEFTGTWNGCINLSKTEFPTLNMSGMLSGSNCFLNVKLTTTSYSSMLTSLCATNFNNNVIFHGGNSTYNTPASSARVFLTKPVINGGRGWTITDGGYQTGT